MTQISQTLLDRAEELRLTNPEEVAVQLLKEAGFSDEDARISVAQHVMEKVAAQELVAMSGIDLDQAVTLVKAAGINIKELTSFQPQVSEVDPTIELLQKAAEYIECLEAELATAKDDIEKIAQESIPEVKLPETIEKYATAGAFTFEDLEQLKAVSPEVMTKLAAAMDEPWEMGRGEGYARPQTDPLLEFMLG